MELPAVRPPRRPWHRRFLTRVLEPSPTNERDNYNYSNNSDKCFCKSTSFMTTTTTSSGSSLVTPADSCCPIVNASRTASQASSAGSSVSSTKSHSHSHQNHHQQQHHLFPHIHNLVHSNSHHVSSRSSRPLSSKLLQHLHRRMDKPVSAPPPARLVLPHTITERHGGKNLWVTAPVISDALEKQGFRWRKKWKTRFVELNGRVLSYYEITSSSSSSSAANSPQNENTTTTTHTNTKLRKSVHITANAHITDVDDRTFSLTPNPGEKPWVFRTRDAKMKLRWCKAVHDCIDILIWLQHYEMGDVLGVGGNGVVRKLVDTRNGRKFAVKIVDASKFKNREAAVAEVEIMRNITNEIKHANLVKIHKVYEEQNKIYMILDLCDGGELYDSIVQRGCYGEKDAAKIMNQLMSAVDALHRHNILHLDLKPENVLLSSKDEKNAKIVLTDFGLARMIHGKANPLEEGKTMAGTIGYIAPEVIASHHYSEAADVFSAGVILFILLVGYPPFYGDSEVEILLKIARGDFQFHAEDWSHISTPAKELVSRMLEVRAQDRITVKEVLAHPWIVEMSMSHSRELRKTVERMQQYNFVRKSENMASCMASMLANESEADYNALVNVKAIDTLIRQLTPSGSDKMVVEKALVLAQHLGLSPYIDVQCFVAFLDRNQDGFIDAQDFCDGVKAMRDGHESFAKIIFDAMLEMVRGTEDEEKEKEEKEKQVQEKTQHHQKQEEEEEEVPPPPPKSTLSQADFAVVFGKLQCPEPLSTYFFKYLNQHPEEHGDEIEQEVFVRLFKHFRFLATLFVHKAKNTMMRIAKSASREDLAQITEEIRESLVELEQ